MRARRCVVVLLAAFIVLGGARPAAGQGTVAGVLTLQERPGADRGDVRTAVVYLEAPGARTVGALAPAELRGGAIEMRGREFRPHVRIVMVGGTIGFPNDDPFSHNVFSNVDLGPFDLGLYRRGITRTATFARAGVYPIYCNIHSKMVSFVVAVPTPWATQPEGDGSFVLRGVPAGTYILHAWHERGAAEVRRQIVVPASGTVSVDVAVDARAYVPAPHLNKFGRPYLVLRADRY